MFEILPSNDDDQNLRIKRFFMAVGAYLIWMGIFFLYGEGKLLRLERHHIFLIFFLITISNLIFYVILRSGLNKRFKDASLTFPQMVVATIWAMLFVYFTNEARGAVLLLYLVVFVFGVFRLRRNEFLILTSLAIISYCIVIYMLYRFHPQNLLLRVELFNIIVLSVVLPWFSFIGGYITNLRKQVHAALALIEKLAIYDDLTQVFNRRQLFKILEHQKALGDRGKVSFSICLFDIDHFKHVNDTYGHEKGDRVLKEVAQSVQKQLRVIDFIARYGGEEFLLILPNSGIGDAIVCAERVRMTTENLRFRDMPEDFRITISIGITIYQPTESISLTINRADKALYRAKHNGRNRIECIPATGYHPEQKGYRC